MLKGKVALITGGGRGIGRAVAALFAENGAKTVICSRSKKELAKTASLADGGIESFVCDVSDEDEVAKIFSEIGDKYGRLDILVNSAAIFSAGKIEDISVDDFRKVFDVNCVGMFLCCREAIKLMKGDGGSIINISSLAGIRSVEKFPGFGAYVVSKFGVIGLTEVLAAECKDYGIRVNAVAPGAVDTQMLQKAAPGLYPRLTPEQVAGTILHLASDSSSGVNGSTIELFANLQKGES